jgi:hypothetical protein
MDAATSAIGNGSTSGTGIKSSQRDDVLPPPLRGWTNFDVNDPLRTTLADALAFLETEGIAYALAVKIRHLRANLDADS